MSLRAEVEQIFADAVEKDPLWAKLADAGPDYKLTISGPLEETLQTLASTLMAYSDALLGVVLHIADAVDDLRENITPQTDGD